MPNWIYIFFIAPIGLFVYTIRVKHSNRLTALEIRHVATDEKVDKICESVDEMKDEFKKMAFEFGRLEEHLRNTPKHD